MNTQKKIKYLFDTWNEIVQDYTLYSTIVKWDKEIPDPERIKFDLSKKYGSLSILVQRYCLEVRTFKL